MSRIRGDFTDLLVKQGVLTRGQRDEALAMQRLMGVKHVQEVIVKLGYVLR